MDKFLLDQFLQLRRVCTDSRNIIPQSIFFALKGEKFNGNLFALDAIKQGAALAVVDEDVAPDHPQIYKVENVLHSLQQLGLDYRLTFDIPVIAITGSNGKTTTKELLRDVLAQKFKVHATKGNLNNHIGVPLTLLSMEQDTEIALIEMGANHKGEIAAYCRYTRPTHALITNMGKAHLEGFGGVEGVRKGKKELYDYVNAHAGLLFVNTELENLRDSSQGMNRIEYGFQTGGLAIKIISENPVLVYAYEHLGSEHEVATHLAGGYNLYNIASAIVIGRHFSVDEERIHKAIAEYVPDNNRSQLVKTDRNMLIMDAYNANPTSTEHAVMALAKQEGSSKYFILGDMLELGTEGPAEHQRIMELTSQLNLDGIFVGPIYHAVAGRLGKKCFVSRDQALEYLIQHPLTGCTVLVKGSRGIQLEKLQPAL